MTDNEIVKALEDAMRMGDAPIGKYWGCMISKLTAKEAVDLINRQKAEIEEMKSKNSNLTSDLSSLRNDLSSAKAEIEKNENIIRLADKTIETANAEIERLKAQCENTQIGYNFLRADIEEYQSELEKFAKRAMAYQTEVNRVRNERDEAYKYAGSILNAKKADIANAKSEAYKEFAEKVKPIIEQITDILFDDNVSKCQIDKCRYPSNIPCGNEICLKENTVFWQSKIDNILKELVGEDDEA